jgi:heme-degrading monooxygenase HmoA
MYVQIFRGVVRDDSWGQLEELSRQWKSDVGSSTEGFQELYLLRDVNDGDHMVVVLLWESQQLAAQSGQQPDTEEYFRRVIELVTYEPLFTGAESVL